MTGSWAAGALNGRHRDPSASTTATSAPAEVSHALPWDDGATEELERQIERLHDATDRVNGVVNCSVLQPRRNLKS